MIALTVFAVLAVLTITNRIGGGTYVGKVLLAFDYFVSVLWDRDFDISISSQCALYWKKGNPPAFWYLLHRGLNAIQKDHCELALAGDLARLERAKMRLTGVQP